VSINHRFTTVELLIYRIERRIAQPFVAVARVEADSVGFERIHPILDLAKAAVDIGQRQIDEQAEAPRVIRSQTSFIVVADSGDAARGGVITEPYPGRRNRGDGGGHAAAVHVLDGLGRSPPLQSSLDLPFTRQFRDVIGRRNVVVDVDAMRRGGRRLRGTGTDGGESS
jgi:hypothetical protein